MQYTQDELNALIDEIRKEIDRQAKGRERDNDTIPDLGSVDLSHLSLVKQDLSDFDFSKSILNGVNLNGSWLEKASFIDADMIHTFLWKVWGTSANFHLANLTEAEFIDANLSRPNFQDCRAQDADFSGSTLLHANFRFANLDGADFTDANLTGADFTEAKLDGARFTRAILDGAIGLERYR